MGDKKFFTVRNYQCQLPRQNKNALTASLEDYLEMIYRYVKDNGHIRINELASQLNVKPSSASKMVVKLAALGFIDYEKYGIIKLTSSGEELGRYLLWRHNTIYKFFSLITQNNSEQPFIEAELVEHILSPDTVENIEKLVDFLTKDSLTHSRFQDYLQSL